MDHSDYSLLSDADLRDEAQSLDEGNNHVEPATDVSSIVTDM